MQTPKSSWYEVVTNAASGESEIVLYGYVGARDEIDERAFVRAFRQLEAAGKPVTLRLNSGGGSVFAGIPIYNAIRSATVDTTVVVEGMAASMASILLQAGTKRRMYKNARVMVHKASGGAFGSAKQMRDAADLLDSVEQTLKDIYVERTGQPADVVDGWLAEGKDTWFTADEALAKGLIDEIVDGTPPTKKKAATAPKNALNEQEMYAHYRAALDEPNEIDDSTLNPQMNLTLISAALVGAGATAALPPDADDAAVVKAIADLGKQKDQRITELQNQLTSQNAGRIEAVLNAAVSSGKIVASQRPTFEKLLKADFDATASVLDGMAAKKSITADMTREGGAGGGAGEVGDDPRAGWSFEKYRKEAPLALEKMRSENPQMYEALKATYLKTLS